MVGRRINWLFVAGSIWRAPLWFAAAALLMASGMAVGVAAQSPTQAGVTAGVDQAEAPLQLLVDVDAGVDDALALLWLLRQQERPVELLGVVTVAGNASAANATNNVLSLWEAAAVEGIPVVKGAEAPLIQPLSRTGALLHGPDGLWRQGQQPPYDQHDIPTDARSFYCTTLAASPGATLLALGPLTNVATALEHCPDIMRTLDNVVILGGARYGGNKTPVAEYNFWQDPEAAARVLGAGLSLSLVPLDAFTKSTFALTDLRALRRSTDPALKLLVPALSLYAAAQIQFNGQAVLPDAVAAAVALEAAAAQRQPALVRIVTEESLARGQSIIGLSDAERVAMLATDSQLSRLAVCALEPRSDPSCPRRINLQEAIDEILAGQPDNAQVVVQIAPDLLIETIFAQLLE